MSWENLFKDQGIFSLVIILLILITVSLDNGRILSGENWCWSLLRLKGLIISRFVLAFFLERAYSRSWDGSVQAHCRRRFGHQKGGACLVGWYPYEVRSPVKEIYIVFFSFNQAAFECMYTLLDTCLDRLDIFEFLSHVEDGLKDHYDIKVREISWLYCLILDFVVSVSLEWRFYEDTGFCATFWQGLLGRAPPPILVKIQTFVSLQAPVFFFTGRARRLEISSFALKNRHLLRRLDFRWLPFFLSSRNAPPLSVAWRHKYRLCSRLDFRTLAFQNTLGLVIAWVILIYFHKDVAVLD